KRRIHRQLNTPRRRAQLVGWTPESGQACGNVNSRGASTTRSALEPHLRHGCETGAVTNSRYVDRPCVTCVKVEILGS
ncbi:hypothetical protein HMPREF1980_00319, partial [Actinomyces sp. oral taxon 172 str. F0311]